MSTFVQPMPLPALVALINDWGTQPRETGNRAEPPPGGNRAETIAVADRLYAVFATTDPAKRAAAVTAMLASTAVAPQLVPTDDALSAAWRVPKAADAVLASAALALRDHLATHPDRLGVCADRQCADVYVDASPAGHRRFCSLTCQNRTRVAAFRERRRIAD